MKSGDRKGDNEGNEVDEDVIMVMEDEEKAEEADGEENICGHAV